MPECGRQSRMATTRPVCPPRHSIRSAHGDIAATLLVARWQLAAHGVVIRFVLQGLAGIKYRLHSSRNGLSTSAAAALSGSRQEPP
jgi:hypothetical protein